MTCVVENRDGEHVSDGPAQQPDLAAIKNHLESVDSVFKPKFDICASMKFYLKRDLMLTCRQDPALFHPAPRPWEW